MRLARIMREPMCLPAWGDDPLSAFMSEAERNVRACSLNWPDIFEVQQRAHALLVRVGEVLEHGSGESHLFFPRMLVLRSHSAILAAMRLAMSGQAVEAQAVLRVAIEGVWYALHIATDPAPPTRANIWRRRGTSREATRECKNEFKVENVRRTHEGLDAPTAAGMQRLYEDAIEFGAHPNQVGVGGSARIDRSGSEIDVIQVGVLTPGTLATAMALKAAVETTVGLARTFRLIYPERSRIVGLNDDVDRLIRHWQSVFPRHAEALRGTPRARSK